MFSCVENGNSVKFVIKILTSTHDGEERHVARSCNYSPFYFHKTISFPLYYKILLFDVEAEFPSNFNSFDSLNSQVDGKNSSKLILKSDKLNAP